jgi:hypothetical protein
MIELQRAAVPHTLPRIERRNRTPEHVRGDGEPAARGDELEVHACARTERPRALDQRAAGAEIDQGDHVPRPKDRLRSGKLWLTQTHIETTID